MALRRPGPRRAAGGRGALPQDPGRDGDQPRDRGAAVAHWGQHTIDDEVVNACDQQLWIEPAEGAPTCQDCAAKATQQMKGHL
jgi:hypothetical protein